jgi:chromosome segregation ATPase
MTNGQESNPHYVKSLVERTVVLERDLYHLGESVTTTTDRLNHLHTRLRTAEYHLDHATLALERLETVTDTLQQRIPDLENVQRLIRWLLDALKYVTGMAIFLGVLSGKLSVGSLESILQM